MKVYFLRNPFALLIVSVLFLVATLIFSLMSFISKHFLPSEILPLIAFNTFYCSGILIAFYWEAYHRNNKAISPKKYKKAMQLYDKNQKLIAFLKENDKNYFDIKPEEAIDLAIQIMSQNNNALRS